MSSPDLHLELTRLIAESKLTQEEIAERLGTKHSAISRMLRPDYKPSMRSLERLAQVLGYRLEVKFVKN